MAWLSDWAKRLKIEIDANRIDNDLTNFPVMITLASGCGLNSFDASDIFNELTPVSLAPVFSDDFSAAGANWTHNAGTTTYTNGYMSQDTANSTDTTTNPINFGENFDAKFRFRINSRGTAAYTASVYFCYNFDGVVDTYPIMVQLSTYSSYPNYWVRVYKKPAAAAAVLLLTDQQYDYYTLYTQWVWCRVVREGTKFFMKIWINPAAEPANWTYEMDNVFDAYSYGSNTGYIRTVCGNVTGANYFNYDDITVSTRTVNSANYPLRIAMTTADGATQLPVEVEHWNQEFKKAYLWTSVPAVASGTNTVLYLYYDKNKYENVDYVGYTNSATAATVWDSNFVFVNHCNSQPTRGVIYDSTSYNNDSTVVTVDSNDWVLTQAGLVYIFNNAAADRVEFGNQSSIKLTAAMTAEAFCRNYSYSATYNRQVFGKGHMYTPTNVLVNRGSWYLEQLNNNRWSFGVSANGTDAGFAKAAAPGAMVANAWDYIAGRYTPSTSVTLWVNDAQSNINTTSIPTNAYDSSDPLMVGTTYRIDYNYNHFDGEITEVRLSNIIRSDAWLKATYYTLLDQMVTVTGVEGSPSFFYDGYIKENSTPVARTVRLYKRDDGQFMDEAESASDTGYYYLTTSISGEHFIVAFDDDAGEPYNALVLDRVYPKGIVE